MFLETNQYDIIFFNVYSQFPKYFFVSFFDFNFFHTCYFIESNNYNTLVFIILKIILSDTRLLNRIARQLHSRKYQAGLLAKVSIKKVKLQKIDRMAQSTRKV
jgi:hypothetical protein